MIIGLFEMVKFLDSQTNLKGLIISFAEAEYILMKCSLKYIIFSNIFYEV